MTLVNAFAKWLFSPLKSAANRLMKSMSDSSYSKNFSTYNFVFTRWPIEVAYDGGLGLFKIVDSRQDVIFVGRRERIPYYRKGVSARIDSLSKEYCAEIVSIRQGDLVIDIGANVGEFSMWASSRGASLISVEPEQKEFNCLGRNLAGREAILINAPVWGKEEDVTLFSKNRSGDSSLIQTENFDEARTMRSTTLDRIYEEHGRGRNVRMLKLEAEGAEPEILEGAQDMIRNVEFILADLGPERGISKENTVIPVFRKLRDCGFELEAVSNTRMIFVFKNVEKSATRGEGVLQRH